MSMTTELASGFDDLLAEGGQQIKYGLATIDALVSFGDEPGRSKDIVRDKATIMVRKTDVANPDYRVAIVISSVRWQHDRLLKTKKVCYVIAITKNERPTL